MLRWTPKYLANCHGCRCRRPWHRLRSSRWRSIRCLNTGYTARIDPKTGVKPYQRRRIGHIGPIHNRHVGSGGDAVVCGAIMGCCAIGDVLDQRVGIGTIVGLIRREIRGNREVTIQGDAGARVVYIRDRVHVSTPVDEPHTGCRYGGETNRVAPRIVERSLARHGHGATLIAADGQNGLGRRDGVEGFFVGICAFAGVVWIDLIGGDGLLVIEGDIGDVADLGTFGKVRVWFDEIAEITLTAPCTVLGGQKADVDGWWQAGVRIDGEKVGVDLAGGKMNSRLDLLCLPKTSSCPIFATIAGAS